MLFEKTIWGSDAGEFIILKPIFTVVMYFLLLFLFHENILLLLFSVFFLPLLNPLFFDTYNLRFLLLPLLVILLGRVLSSGGRVWGTVLGALLVLQTILTPEACYTIPAWFGALFAYRFFNREKLPSSLKWTILGATVTGLAWAVFLAAHHALLPYLENYRDVASDPQMGLGLPLPIDKPMLRFLVYTPFLVNIVFVGYFVVRWKRRSLRPIDWTLFAYNLFCVLYLQKFIARADEHIIAHVRLASPILLWLVFEALKEVEGRWNGTSAGLWLTRHITPHSVTAVLILPFLFVFGSPWLITVVEMFPVRLSPFVNARSHWARFGYDERLELKRILPDFQSLFDQVLEPGDTVFDFTNETALFHYFLERPPAGRYLTPSTLPRMQDKMISELAGSGQSSSFTRAGWAICASMISPDPCAITG